MLFGVAATLARRLRAARGGGADDGRTTPETVLARPHAKALKSAPLVARQLALLGGGVARGCCAQTVTELEALLWRQECDPFARLPGTPALAELAAGNRPLLRLCREVRLGWSPVRHRLFHPAHRSTVVSLLLVARHVPKHRGIGWRWVAEIPTEVWFMIAGQFGRLGWPNNGRDALPLQMPRRA